ncbi:hypothetical protein RND81_07G172900 [Saponaria officinalis]|uniref:BHLH domain-containing protein n=1 Tax=Saponaria officinalis TaxID=3572 RepID=A0AAW1JTE7_SAPOF
MDMSGKNNLELEKRGDKPLAYDHPPMSGEWQFNDANFVNSSMGPISNGMNSHGPSMWEHPLDSVSIGLNGMNVDSDGVIASDPLSMLKGSLFVPSTPTMLPHSLSEFPADSAFIERAARFSSFSGGHFSELLNPLGSQSVSSYLCGGGTMMQGPQGLLSGNAMKMLPNTQPQTSDGNVAETSRDVSLSQDHGVAEVGSPMNKIMVSRNDSDGPEFSGGGSREGRAPSSVKRLGANKRKRSNQDIESEQANAVQQQSGEAGKKQAEIPQKGEQNSVPTANKSNGKQSSQNSDPPKDDYIHVRARRGQATNSHSLAERVRREKISERMKFLQDLVPGCSKVTGKAVMLDEIINYVQSLQRQVEFLSMKLATVHPKLDFNIDQLLAKDQMLSARSCPSGVGSSPSMPMAYPPLHPGIANCSDFLRRTISSQLTNMGEGYKEPAHQLPNAWEDELHNVVQMGFNASDSLDNQETICPTSQGSMEAEP